MSPLEQPRKFFVDRSLGRVAVPRLLREAGWDLITLAEHYGVPQDETIEDTRWIEDSAKLGWAVLMKDKRIRYRRKQRLPPSSSIRPAVSSSPAAISPPPPTPNASSPTSRPSSPPPTLLAPSYTPSTPTGWSACIPHITDTRARCALLPLILTGSGMLRHRIHRSTLYTR